MLKEIAAKKNGERVHATPMGRVRPWSRALLSAVVQAVARGALLPGLRLEEGASGWAHSGPNSGALGAVPEVRLPAGADFPRAAGLEDEPGAGVPPLATRRASTGSSGTGEVSRGILNLTVVQKTGARHPQSSLNHLRGSFGPIGGSTGSRHTLAVRVLTGAPVDYGIRSCVDLPTIRVQQAAGLASLAEWMDRHCSGELEFTNAFCRVQSRMLLERLDEAAEVESAWRAKRCRPALHLVPTWPFLMEITPERGGTRAIQNAWWCDAALDFARDPHSLRMQQW